MIQSLVRGGSPVLACSLWPLVSLRGAVFSAMPLAAYTRRRLLDQSSSFVSDASEAASSSEWPWAAAPEGSCSGDGGVWSCVDHNNVVRVFRGPRSCSSALLLRAVAVGPVLRVMLLPSLRAVLTLEETSGHSGGVQRSVRIYRWTDNDDNAQAEHADTEEKDAECEAESSADPSLPPPSAVDVLELVSVSAAELAASRVPAAPGVRRVPPFSPSLVSVCHSSGTVALAHDTQIRLFDLSDIFGHGHSTHDTNTHSTGTRNSRHRTGKEAHREEMEEPGASPLLADPDDSSLSRSASLSSSVRPVVRRFLLSYCLHPLATLESPFVIRHLDLKQSFLSFSARNETKLLCIRWNITRTHDTEAAGDTLGDDEWTDVKMPLPRVGSVGALPPTSAPAPAAPPKRQSASQIAAANASAAAAASAKAAAAAAAALAAQQPFELIGVRRADPDLRLRVRADVDLRECSLVLHRRFSPADQIHTVQLVPTLGDQTRRNQRAEVRHRDRLQAEKAHSHTLPHSSPAGLHSSSSFVSAAAPPISAVRGSLRAGAGGPPLRASAQSPGMQLGSPSRGALAASSHVAMAASPSVSRAPALLSAKQELFAMLGQGLPTLPFTVPLVSEFGSSPGSASLVAPGSSFYSAANPSAASGPPVVVELLDEEDDGPGGGLAGGAGGAAKIAAVLQQLEDMEDQAEADDTWEHETHTSTDNSDEEKAGRRSHSDDSSAAVPPASSPCRVGACVDLHVRLLVSTAEECYSYDLDADVRLSTYVFEHDLLVLATRGSFLLALTTAGLEIHSLWSAHPMLQFLTVPLCVQRDEPITAKGMDCKRKVQDMLVTDEWILFRQSAAPYAPMGSRSGSSSNLVQLSSTPPASRFPSSSASFDPCDCWPPFPVQCLPSVVDVYSKVISPLALRSMRSSATATPSAIRLFTEASIMLTQRMAQIRACVGDEPEESAAGHSSAGFLRLCSELASVAHSLSSAHSHLAHLFLSSHELGLACYFFCYQSHLPLPQLWSELQEAMRAEAKLAATSNGAAAEGMLLASSRCVTKLLIKLLLFPSLAEQHLLRTSPALISSFVHHLESHAPHLLASVLLKTYLLHTPYDPKEVLRVLEDNSKKGNYEAQSASGGTAGGTGYSSYRPSRGASSAGTPTGSASGSVSGSYRVRPVVFHTFVQALMHLQIQSASSSAALVAGAHSSLSNPMAPGQSGRDCAAILLNSFSAQSLEHLLVTYSALLRSWPHRHTLVEFLRSSVPSSLLEVCIVLTQRGDMHVHEGVDMMMGTQAAAAILQRHNDHAAVSSSLLSPVCAVVPLLPPHLCIYLECSVSPFMLSQDIGSSLETNHSMSIPPWDTSDSDMHSFEEHAPQPQASQVGESSPAPVAGGVAVFEPYHVRHNDLHSPHQVVLRESSVRAHRSGISAHGRTGRRSHAMSRDQVADLVVQLACVYLQQEIAEQAAAGSTAHASQRGVSPSSVSPPASSLGLRRAASSSSLSSATASAADFGSKHSLVPWWRAAWLDELAPSASPRMRKLQALLCGPLPMTRQHFQRIFALLLRLMHSSPQSVLSAVTCVSDPVRASLLLLVLPRVGQLAAALRLLVARAPERCMWPYAQIYCGDTHTQRHDTGDTQPSVQSVPSAVSCVPPRLLHWQLLHAILLTQLVAAARHTTHDRGSAQSGERTPLSASVVLMPPPPPPPSSSLSCVPGSASSLLLSGLLPPDLIAQIDAATSSDTHAHEAAGDAANETASSPTAAPVASDTSSILVRSCVLHRLYVFLLERLVERHSPCEFLTFIPACGAASFYLTFVQKNFSWQRQQQTDNNEPQRRSG